MSEPKKDVYGRVIYDPEDIAKNKVLCAIGYIPILFLIPLFACKDSPFARFHANQGLFFTLIALVGGVLAYLFSFTGPGLVLGWVIEALLAILFLRQFIGTICGGTPTIPGTHEKYLIK